MPDLRLDLRVEAEKVLEQAKAMVPIRFKHICFYCGEPAIDVSADGKRWRCAACENTRFRANR